MSQAYAVAPIIDDPKRFRPRLLGSSPYKFKTLLGQIQAGRDAARDIHMLLGRTRWAQGVLTLRKRFKSLRTIFKEMVAFVGDCREQIGGSPMLSVTVNMGAVDGMAALPTMLATDIETLLRSRKVSQVASELSAVLSEVVDAYAEALEAAIGETMQRQNQRARESKKAALGRLAGDLHDLATRCEAAFAEARQNDFDLAAPELGLLERAEILANLCADLDRFCDVAADLKGAPSTKEFHAIKKRAPKDIGVLIPPVTERVAWLEALARYRVEQ